MEAADVAGEELACVIDQVEAKQLQLKLPTEISSPIMSLSHTVDVLVRDKLFIDSVRGYRLDCASDLNNKYREAFAIIIVFLFICPQKYKWHARKFET